MAGYPFRMIGSSQGVPNRRPCLEFGQGRITTTVIPGAKRSNPSRGAKEDLDSHFARPGTTAVTFYVSTNPVLDPLAAESLRPWGSAR